MNGDLLRKCINEEDPPRQLFYNIILYQVNANKGLFTWICIQSILLYCTHSTDLTQTHPWWQIVIIIKSKLITYFLLWLPNWNRWKLLKIEDHKNDKVSWVVCNFVGFPICCRTIACIFQHYWFVYERSRLPLFSLDVLIG